MVKHYHGPLCRIYHIIIAELLDINKDIALQMAFKAINNSINLNSLIPTLLIIYTTSGDIYRYCNSIGVTG